MNRFVIHVSGFGPILILVVLNRIGFVMNITGFVPNMTEFVLNITGLGPDWSHQ